MEVYLVQNAIPISDDQKSFIANGIYRAITQDMPEVIAEHNLPTTLGGGLFRWNFVNRNLSENLNGDFETSIQPRGSWRLLLLRDKTTNLSFSIMSESNFRKVQRSVTDSIHYLEALISHNKNREPLSQQLSFLPDNRYRDENILSNLRDQLLSCFTGIVEEHVLILFDYNFAGVTSARAVLLTPKMEIAVSEDWTQFLRSTVIPKNTLLDDILADDEVLATLKPQFDANNIPIVEPAEKTRKDEIG